MIGGLDTKKTRENNTYYINKENNNFREKKIGGFSNLSLVAQQFTYTTVIGIYTCINVPRTFQT